MKRIISMVLIFLVVLPFSVLAKSGDIAGKYYSTDIHTFLNGHEIDSINIGGQTLINAEAMHYYSFTVFWDGVERRLIINRQEHPINGEPPIIKKSNYPSGMVLGNYYETDIITSLDGKPITAYNIGGRTYIHAEEMQAWGYVVTWNETDRLLDIVSADRAGYEYSIALSGGKPTTEEGVGSFSIDYTNNTYFGTEDADHFTSSIHCSGKGYWITTAFYQNDALFYSTKLMDKLRSYVSSGIYEEQNINPSEKYDIINKSVRIFINGYPAKNISVSFGMGNGHNDYQFAFDGIPLFKKDEIKEIHFSIDKNENAEKYEIIIPIYGNQDEIKERNEIEAKLKKNPEDFVDYRYEFEDYMVIKFCEIPVFGKVIRHAYVIRREDKEILYDLFDKVRGFEGYDYEDLILSDVKVGDVKNNIFFACSSPKRHGNFYVEADTGNIYFLSEYIK